MVKSATFLLYGDIIDHENKSQQTIFGDMDIPGVSSQDINNFLEQNKNAEEIIIRINSRGGSVQEGFLIYDLLRNSGKKVTTIGEGKVFSVATVIFLAGEKRIMMQHSDGLIHLPHIPEYTLKGKYESEDLERIAKQLRQEEDKVIALYVERTEADSNKLREYMEKETLLSADDMVSLGFATDIQEALKAVAFYNINQKQINMANQDFEKKADGFISRLQSILAKFSRIENKSFVDVAGNEFTVEREEGEIQVGDLAQPDGEFVLEDGTKVVISEGAISEIVAPENDLEKENEELKKKIASYEAKIQSLEEQAGEMAEASAEIDTVIAELKSFKSSVIIEGRKKDFKGPKKVSAVDKEQVISMLNKINGEGK